MKPQSKQSWTVAILANMLIFLALWHFVRIYRAIVDWAVLENYGANPVYLLAAGVVWSFLALLVMFWMMRRWPHARRAGIAFSVLYYSWYWADRLWVQPSPAPNLIYSVVISTFLLLVFIGGLFTPQAKDYFIKETA